jgi:hypothetical protein
VPPPRTGAARPRRQAGPGQKAFSRRSPSQFAHRCCLTRVYPCENTRGSRCLRSRGQVACRLASGRHWTGRCPDRSRELLRLDLTNQSSVLGGCSLPIVSIVSSYRPLGRYRYDTTPKRTLEVCPLGHRRIGDTVRKLLIFGTFFSALVSFVSVSYRQYDFDTAGSRSYRPRYGG